MCNRDDGPADALASDIAALVLTQPPAVDAPPPVAANVSRPSAPPITWVGRYRAPGNGNVVLVHAGGDGIVMELGGRRFPLRAVGGDVYQVIGAPIDSFARFERTGERRRLVPVDSDEPPMEAFEPANPTAAELAAYSGAYECPEIEATIAIQAKAGKLVASLPLGETQPLQPLERGAFAAPNLVFDFDDPIGRKTQGFRLDQWRAWGMRCHRVSEGKSLQ